MARFENNILEFIVVDAAVLVREVPVKTEEINEKQDLLTQSIKEVPLAIPSSVLADALNSEALSWHFEEGVRRVKLNYQNNYDAFDEDFRITAKITLRHLLKREDKFSVLIEEINKPQHIRTDTTNALIQDVAMNIKNLAEKEYLKRELVKELDR